MIQTPTTFKELLKSSELHWNFFGAHSARPAILFHLSLTRPQAPAIKDVLDAAIEQLTVLR